MGEVVERGQRWGEQLEYMPEQRCSRTPALTYIPVSVRRRQCNKCTISLKEINTNEKPTAGAGKGPISNRPPGGKIQGFRPNIKKFLVVTHHDSTKDSKCSRASRNLAFCITI